LKCLKRLSSFDKTLCLDFVYKAETVIVILNESQL